MDGVTTDIGAVAVHDEVVALANGKGGIGRDECGGICRNVGVAVGYWGKNTAIAGGKNPRLHTALAIAAPAGRTVGGRDS